MALFGSLIGRALKSSITKLKGLAQKHFDACKRLKNRLKAVVQQKANSKVNELKRRMILKYYGVDDEGALTSTVYDSSKGNAKYLSSKEGDT